VVLLRAVGQFLLGELYPVIEDQRLKFRVLVAAHLASTLASEVESEAEVVEGELESLAKLMPDLRPASGQAVSQRERRELLATLNQELSARLRDGRFDSQHIESIREHLKQVLIRSLAIVSPRFDTSREIETG
jgi:hypothetical protein